MVEFGACWEGLEDPRTGNATLHHLHDLLMIALCSVICGGENAMDMAAFEKATEPLLRGFLRLPNGVPSHDTFSRLFRLLDPAPFGLLFSGSWRCFRNNVKALWPSMARFYAARTTTPAVNQRCTIVSAWGCEERMVVEFHQELIHLRANFR